MRALQIIASNETLIENLNIINSTISTNHLLYFSDVLDLQINNSKISGINKSQSIRGDLRVIKFGTLPKWNEVRINYIKIQNFTYKNSQMPFLDIQGTVFNPRIKMKPNQNDPYPGEIAISISDCIIEHINLSDQLKMITTQNIQLKGMIMKIERTIFRNNIMDKGQMFEFKHNFRLAAFFDCLIENNQGYFLIASPSNQANNFLQQTIRIQNANVLRNTGQAQGIFHVLSNAYLEIQDSNFIQNVGFGRGSLIYCELPDSFASIINSNFIRNSGYQGGLFFTEIGGQLSCMNSLFESNFAFEGGVGFLQNDGQMIMVNNEYRFNLAFRGSLFFVFNSYNDIQVEGGYIHENGFIYHPNIHIHLIWQNQSLLQRDSFRDQLTQFNSVLSNNSDYLKFLIYHEKKIKTSLQRNQYTDNPQIQIIKASIIINNGLLVLNQHSLIKAQSVSKVILIDMLIFQVKNITSPLIFADQSDVVIEKLTIQQTQSTVPILDVQSDSQIKLSNIQIQNHFGPILNLFNANATIDNSKFQFINFTKSMSSIFRVQNGILNISQSSISYIYLIDLKDLETQQSNVFKIRSSQLNIQNLQANDFNVALVQSANSIILIVFSNFQQIQNKNARGLVLNAEESNANISSCNFKHIEGLEGSAIFFYKQQQQPNNYQINIDSSNFSDIRSFQGGAIYTLNTNLSIRSSNFSNNLAGVSGSSLYLSCSKESLRQCEIEMINNTFEDSKAYTQGGAIFYDRKQPLGLFNNSFRNNSATYGMDYGSYPTHLKLINNFTEVAKRLVSGRNLETQIQIGLFDQDDQLYSLDSQSDCLLATDDLNISVSGNTKVRAQNGICVFEDIQLIGYPQYQTSLTVHTNAIPDQINYTSSIDLPIQFRECLPGEVLQNRKCLGCIKGTFSIDPRNTTCQSCPRKATCPGGSEIILNSGTWRKDIKSDIIYDCLVSKACLQDYYHNSIRGGLNSTCSKEYSGILCSKCYGRSGDKIYARSVGIQCAECSPLGTQLSLFIIVFIGRASYAGYILYNLLEKPKRNKPQTVLIRILTNYFQVISLVRGFNLEWPQAINAFLSTSVKIADSQDSFFSFDCIFLQLRKNQFATYYSQVILMGVTPILMSLLSIPIWAIVLKLRCICKNWKRQSIDSESIKAMISRESSIISRQNGGEQGGTGNIYAGRYLTPEMAQSRLRRSATHRDEQGSWQKNEEAKQPKTGGILKKQAAISKNSSHSSSSYSLQSDQEQQFSFKHKLLTTFFVIVMLWHPQIINYSFSLFNCISYEDGNSYLRNDTSIKCWQGRDLLIQLTIGGTMIFIWGLVFPAFIFWQIKKQKGNLKNKQNLRLYGIFYIGLNDDMFFWEIVVVNMRKMSLIIAATFLPTQRQSMKGYIGIIGILIQRHYSHYTNPFQDPNFNYIEDLASQSMILTIFGGIFFLQDGVGDRNSGISTFDTNQESLKVIIFCVVVLYNAYFLAKWIFAFGLVQIRNHFEIIKKALSILGIEIQNDIVDYKTDLKNRKAQKKDEMNYQSQKLIEEVPECPQTLATTHINKKTSGHTLIKETHKNKQKPSLLNLSIEGPLSPIQGTLNDRPQDGSLAQSERSLLNEIDQCMNESMTPQSMNPHQRNRIEYRNVDKLSFAEDSKLSHVPWRTTTGNLQESNVFQKIIPKLRRQKLIRELEETKKK